jgi:hypothetical protein
MTKEPGIKMGSVGFDRLNKSYDEKNLKRRRKGYEDSL